MFYNRTKLFTHVCLLLITAGFWMIPASAKAADNDPVWRVQVRLFTGGVSNAGTDDDISVSLNAQNRTYLDHDHNDFEAGSQRIYDLSWRNVYRLADFGDLVIRNHGDDGWCMEKIVLWVNGQSVLTYEFGNGCQWLDTDPGYPATYRIPRSVVQRALRDRYNHRAAVDAVVANRIHLSQIDAMLTGKIGNLIGGSDPMYWRSSNGGGVQVRVKDANYPHNPTLGVHLNLKLELNNAKNPDVDVDFDVTFQCDGGFVATKITNMRQKISGAFGLAGYVNDGGQQFYDMSLRWPFYGNSCPTVYQVIDGNLFLDPTPLSTSLDYCSVPVLFEHAERVGKPYVLNADYPNLHDFNAGDRVSSICVPSGDTIVIYEHVNYSGQAVVLRGPVFIRNLATERPGWNDRISSVRVSLR